MIDDFSIRREILNMFKISRRICIIATVSSDGGRRRTKPKTMDNYDLLSITIENEFLKNAIRWPSRGLFQAIRLNVRRHLSKDSAKSHIHDTTTTVLG